MKKNIIEEKAIALIKETFDEEWLSKTNLTFDEQRVLANLLYSWRVTSKATSDYENGLGFLIRSIEQLRKTIHIAQNALYKILNDFETKYKYIDWERGETRVKGKEPKAAKFTIYIDRILTTPAPQKMTNFKELLKLKNSISTASINTNTKLNTNNNVNANVEISSNVIRAGITNLEAKEKINNNVNATSNSKEDEITKKNYYANADSNMKEAIDKGMSYNEYKELLSSMNNTFNEEEDSVS